MDYKISAERHCLPKTTVRGESSKTVNRDVLEFLNEKEKSMLKKDAHISKKIVRQHYKVFKDGYRYNN